MKIAAPRIGLPLLGKELVEQAARARTYIMRVSYAALLFLAGFLFYYQLVGRYNSSPFAVLGKGRELYQSLVNLQFIGIFLFMPALTCGAITIEKERQSLGLLLLTRLGPWTILLEKYLGRVIPMLMFLLLSLPLMVIAYSLGGISQNYLWSGVWFLILATFQFGALALLCSTFFRTTVGAFIGTYILAIFMVFTLPTVDGIFGLELRNSLDWLLSQAAANTGWNPVGDWVPWAFMPAAIWEITSRGAPSWEIAMASMPIILVTSAMLFLSRRMLVSRAFLPPSNVLLQLFHRLDKFFHELNDNRFTKGRVLIRDNTPMHTVLEPVAWRETTKTTFGAIRYLIRLFIVLEVPVLLVAMLCFGIDGSHEPMSILCLLMWVIVTLIVSAKATSLVTGERSHETLDVLLTTPMTSREVMLQKFRGVKRLILVTSIPLLTIMVLKFWILVGTGIRSYSDNRTIDWTLYITCAMLSVAVYLPMVAWLALLIGVRLKSQAKAIFATLGAIVTWCALPLFLLLMAFEIMRLRPQDEVFYLLLLSPATILPFNEFFQLERTFSSAWLAVGINFGFHGLLLLLFRKMGLSNLDHHLGRSSGK